jgi:hypothetical protein
MVDHRAVVEVGVLVRSDEGKTEVSVRYCSAFSN